MANGSTACRVELQRISQNPELALVIFDGYLCPAEYLLYGPTPYGEVIELANGLRETARRWGCCGRWRSRAPSPVKPHSWPVICRPRNAS